ncbi:MAG: hypothetical protein GY928_04060 [Colwellia sp.]|nr:hypothetical protein [Colwellia sp.]
MSHLRAGRKFFAEVYNVGKGTVLYENGVRNKDVLYCSMLDETSEDPRVVFHLLSGDVTIKGKEDFYETWIVYAGTVDGEYAVKETSFINDKVLNKAKKVLKELKENK